MSSLSRPLRMGLLLLVALLALLFLLPMGMAAKLAGVSARNSQGIVLIGALRDMSVGRLAVGDVNVRLLPSRLLTGRIAFSLYRGDAPHFPGVSGEVGRSFGGYFVEQLRMSLDGSGLGAGLDGGDIRLESLSLRFAGDGCQSANGVVRVNLDQTALGAIVKGDLIGTAECRNDDLVLPLLSQSTMEKLTLRIGGDGKYTATLYVAEPAPENVAALTLSGFAPVAGGYQLVKTGSFN